MVERRLIALCRLVRGRAMRAPWARTAVPTFIGDSSPAWGAELAGRRGPAPPVPASPCPASGALEALELLLRPVDALVDRLALRRHPGDHLRHGRLDVDLVGDLRRAGRRRDRLDLVIVRVRVV